MAKSLTDLRAELDALGVAYTEDEKATALAAKLKQARTAVPAESTEEVATDVPVNEAPVAPAVSKAPEGTQEVRLLDAKGTLLRVFTEESHGKNFVEVAQSVLSDPESKGFTVRYK